MGGPAEKLNAPRRRPRRCAGCGAERPKTEMIRVVRSPEGLVSIEATGKAPGRGAYLCRNADCLSRAKKRDALARTLKHPVPPEVYTKLEEFCIDPGKPPDG